MVAWVVGLSLSLILGGSKPPSPLELLGRLDAHDLPEASGIVKSRRFGDVYWTHNDSGNQPFLFAIRRDGSTVRRYKVDVANIDWEDVAIDESGYLYLGDIGNNGGHLPIRVIYQVAEPDPTQPADKPLKPIQAWFYTFPRDGRFDAESLFIDHGRAVLAAKTFDDREAELYELPLDRPAPLFRPAVAAKVGFLPRFTKPATGADLSADGRWLAVCSASATRVYTREKTPDAEKPAWTLFAEVEYPNWHVEGICWDGRDLILAGEDQTLRRLTELAWRKGAVRHE